MQLIDNFVHKSKPPEQTLYRTYLFLYFTSTERDKKKVQLGRLKQVQQRSRCTIDCSLFKAYIESACFRKKFGTWTRNILDPRALLQSSSLFAHEGSGVQTRKGGATILPPFSYPPLKNFYDKARMSHVDVLFPCARRKHGGYSSKLLNLIVRL